MARLSLRDTALHTFALFFFMFDFERYIHEYKPEDFPRVSTKDHFEIAWGRKREPPSMDRWDLLPIPLLARSVGMVRDVRLRNGHTKTDYGLVGDFSGAGGESPDEVMVFTHGWLASPESSLGRLSMMRHVMEVNGYTDPVLGFTWDSGNLTFEWDPGKEIARRNGAKLAQFTYDYKQDNPDTKIRYVSNSLGAIVVLEALKCLDDSGVSGVVESVSMLGAAVDSDSVSVEGRYGAGVQGVNGEVHNYWIENDGTLNQFYMLAEGCEALGGTGAVGVTPVNYFDHHVDFVSDHFSYYRKEKGCIPQLLDDIGH